MPSLKSPPSFTPEQEQALEAFRQFCLNEYAQADPDKKFDADEEQDWTSLSLGFFAALGLSAEHAHDLARHARYDLQYWN